MTTYWATGRKITFLLFTLFIVGILYFFSPILTPFLVGAILAYLCNPIVDLLMRLGLSRIMAVLIVFISLIILIVLLLILLVPPIENQFYAFVEQAPKMLAYVETKTLPWLDRFGIGLKGSFPTLESLRSENIAQASSFIKSLLRSGITLFEVLLNIILIPVVTFYLLRDWDLIINNIYQMIPPKARPTLVKIVKECDAALSGFLRGQLLVMISLSVYYAVTLSFMGLQFGMTIGLITGLISIVPYLGMVVGVIIATVTALMQFGTLTSLLWVILIFLVGHGLENAYLSPKLIGERVGLHPIAVIFAILAGAQLFGFFGVLLALPVSAVAMVLLRHLVVRYQKSAWYKSIGKT